MKQEITKLIKDFLEETESQRTEISDVHDDFVKWLTQYDFGREYICEECYLDAPEELTRVGSGWFKPPTKPNLPRRRV